MFVGTISERGIPVEIFFIIDNFNEISANLTINIELIQKPKLLK